MVFYFISEHDGEKYILYMGRDKFENEELIKHGFGNDIWFHVNDLSSAHVYLRFPKGSEEDIDKIPAKVLSDCCYLVKQNSIKGSKMPKLKIVYTYWRNLKKDGSMEVGQVGFHDNRMLRYTTIEGKDREALARLKQTMVEKPTDIIQKQKALHERNLRKAEKKLKQQREEEERQRLEREKEAAEERKAQELADQAEMQSNVDLKMTVDEYEDDFM